MKVINYESHHVMGVKDIRFDLEGSHLFIVGGANGQGKTSSIKSLLMAVCGRSGMDQYPEPALKDGEDEGWVKVKLTGEESWHENDHITVELHFTRRPNGTVKEEFRVLDSAGCESPEPRTLLQQLYSTKAFDPLSFDRMKKADRRRVLMDLVGLDFSLFSARRKALYEERSSVNSEAKRRTALLQSKTFHDDVPSEMVSTKKLMRKLQLAEQKNSDIAAMQERYEKIGTEIDFTEKTVKKLKEDLQRHNARLSALLDDHEKLHCEIEDHPPLVNLEEIRREIVEANTVNAKVAENGVYAGEQDQVSELEAKSKDLTSQIASLDEEQDAMLAAAKWPIEGMSVDENGVTLDGLPFEAACKSRRVKASVAVGMSLNPSLRLLVCEDGSDLDLDTMQAIDKELQENDFQMIVEVVTRTKMDEEMCAVVISDGEVKC